MDPLDIFILTHFIPYTLALLVMIGFACGLYRFLHFDDNPRRTRDQNLAVVYAHDPEDGVNDGVENTSPALRLTPR